MQDLAGEVLLEPEVGFDAALLFLEVEDDADEVERAAPESLAFALRVPVRVEREVDQVLRQREVWSDGRTGEAAAFGERLDEPAVEVLEDAERAGLLESEVVLAEVAFQEVGDELRRALDEPLEDDVEGVQNQLDLVAGPQLVDRDFPDQRRDDFLSQEQLLRC